MGSARQPFPSNGLMPILNGKLRYQPPVMGLPSFGVNTCFFSVLTKKMAPAAPSRFMPIPERQFGRLITRRNIIGTTRKTALLLAPRRPMRIVCISPGAPSKSLKLTAVSHTGKQLWQSDLGPVKGGHGFGASPIVYGDLIVLNNDQDGESSLIAVHKATGKIAWQTPRNSKRLTYSTPGALQSSRER